MSCVSDIYTSSQQVWVVPENILMRTVNIGYYLMLLTTAGRYLFN